MSMLLSLRPSLALPPHVLKSILYIYLFIPALQLGSSVPFFFDLHFLMANDAEYLFMCSSSIFFVKFYIDLFVFIELY